MLYFLLLWTDRSFQIFVWVVDENFPTMPTFLSIGNQYVNKEHSPVPVWWLNADVHHDLLVTEEIICGKYIFRLQIKKTIPFIIIKQNGYKSKTG